MLIRSLHHAHVLVAGDQKFEGAGGVFDVPEAIGRVLIAFPHFEEVVETAAADVGEQQATEPRTASSGRRRSVRKG